MIRNRIRNKYHNKKVAICSAVPEGTFSLPKSELVPLEDLSKRKIAVAVHVFYIDLFEEICAYLNHIPVKYSLFISISDERDRPNISDMAQRLIHAEHVSIKIVPNRGRDIAPLLIDFADNLNNYDYICHIHTKKSFYSKRERVEWRLYLLRCCSARQSRYMQYYLPSRNILQLESSTQVLLRKFHTGHSPGFQTNMLHHLYYRELGSNSIQTSI